MYLLDFIGKLDDKRGNKVLADLREWVPWSNPEEWVRSECSRKLRGTDSILEFRWLTRKGGTFLPAYALPTVHGSSS